MWLLALPFGFALHHSSACSLFLFLGVAFGFGGGFTVWFGDGFGDGFAGGFVGGFVGGCCCHIVRLKRRDRMWSSADGGGFTVGQLTRRLTFCKKRRVHLAGITKEER